MRDLGAHHRVGAGRHFVLEACESDGSFLNYRNCSQVITSLEADHLDQHHTFENVIGAFRDFVKAGRSGGFLVYCADHALLGELARLTPGRPVSYGTPATADYRVLDVASSVRDCSFLLEYPGGRSLNVQLSVPGAHNAMNASAVFAAAGELGVEPDVVAEALAGFTGAERRFDVLYDGRGILVVDDYAHHPTEIEATLRTARQGWDGRTIAIFQPHLYSRTQLLMDRFAEAFADADEVILTEIYGAREDPLPGVDGRSLYDAVCQREAHKIVRFMPTKEEIVDHLVTRLAPGDMAICIGAGDIRGVGEHVAEALQTRRGPTG